MSSVALRSQTMTKGLCWWPDIPLPELSVCTPWNSGTLSGWRSIQCLPWKCIISHLPKGSSRHSDDALRSHAVSVPALTISAARVMMSSSSNTP